MTMAFSRPLPRTWWAREEKDTEKKLEAAVNTALECAQKKKKTPCTHLRDQRGIEFPETLTEDLAQALCLRG